MKRTQFAQLVILVTLATDLAACGTTPEPTDPRLATRPATAAEVRTLTTVADIAVFTAVRMDLHLRTLPTVIEWRIALDAPGFVQACGCYGETYFPKDGAPQVTLTLLDGQTRQPTDRVEWTSAAHEMAHILASEKDHDTHHADPILWTTYLTQVRLGIARRP